MEMIVLMIVRMVGIYLLLGLLFSLFFLWKGAAKIDAGAEGGSIGFKLLILPATVVFWPFLLYKSILK